MLRVYVSRSSAQVRSVDDLCENGNKKHIQIFFSAIIEVLNDLHRFLRCAQVKVLRAVLYNYLLASFAVTPIVKN